MKRLELERQRKIDERWEHIATRELALAEVADRETASASSWSFPAGGAQELARRMRTEESVQNLGNPWWSDMAGLTMDDAWRRGFPDSAMYLAYWGADEASVANNDVLRLHVLRVCRALYAQHPHARGIVNAAKIFLCGSQGWAVDPTPKMPELDDLGPKPVMEAAEDSVGHAARMVLHEPGSTMARLSYGNETHKGSAPLTSVTSKRGKTWNIKVHHYHSDDGKNIRLLASAGKPEDFVDAGIHLRKEGEKYHVLNLHGGDTFSGLGGKLYRYAKRTFPLHPMKKGAPVSAQIAKHLKEDVYDPVTGVVAPVKMKEPSAPPALGTQKPKDVDDTIDYTRQQAYRVAWKRYCKRKKIHPSLSDFQFWCEAVFRFLRDGEVFIYLGHAKDDGRLTPRFLEPEDITTPVGASQRIDDPRLTGVEVDPEDQATVVAYWWRPSNRPEVQHQRIEASKILYINHSTDTGCRRGLPLLFTARQMLRHFDTWIQQALKSQRIQSSIALLRQWEKTDMTQIRSMLDAKKYRENDVQTPAGNTQNYRTVDMLPVIDAPKGMTLNPFVPAGNFADSEILVRRVLLSVASSVNQSEAMVTADGSNGNYASTRITQFIPLRQFETDQALIGDMKEEYYRHWLATESLLGRVPKAEAESHYDCTVTPARLPNFEAEVVAQTAIGLHQAGIWSRKTAQLATRVDPDEEDAQIEEEKAQQLQEERAAADAMRAMQPQLQEIPVDDEGNPISTDDNEDETEDTVNPVQMQDDEDPVASGTASPSAMGGASIV